MCWCFVRRVCFVCVCVCAGVPVQAGYTPAMLGAAYGVRCGAYRSVFLQLLKKTDINAGAKCVRTCTYVSAMG